jgi:phosphoglycolate phosphatase-like HAD superfamily hydrolase
LLNRPIVRNGKPYPPATLAQFHLRLDALEAAAAAEHNIALNTGYMLGDRWRDIDCGHAAKCTTLLVDRGYREPLRMQPHFRVSDLVAATRIIS